MTNSLGSQGFGSGRDARSEGGLADIDENVACGWDLDWSKGLDAVPRPSFRPPAISGSVLTQVIEGQIIPKLLLAHSESPLAGSEASGEMAIAPVLDSDTFARLVLISEPDEIVSQIEVLMKQGVKLERIYLDLLSPVARLLGVLWEEDRCTFADVTLGLSRLHQVLHEIGRRHAGFPRSTASSRRVHFAPVPGEQHTFGLSMLQEFFRNAGWETSVDHAATSADLLHTVSTQFIDVMGFSVGCLEFLDPLSDLIKRTRAASCNRDIVIMIGGRVFADHPEQVTRFQGRAVVTDGVDAVRTAEKIVAEQSRNEEAIRLM